MDLGLQQKSALVCASNKGLGHACAQALARAGADVVLVARTAETLAATAAEIRKDIGVKVIEIAADITTESGRGQALNVAARLRHAKPAAYEIIITNTGGPPRGTVGTSVTTTGSKPSRQTC